MKITYDLLRNLGACMPSLAAFEEHFGRRGYDPPELDEVRRHPECPPEWYDWMVARVPGLSLDERLRRLKPDRRWSKFVDLACHVPHRYALEQLELIANASTYPCEVLAMIAVLMSFDVNPEIVSLDTRFKWLAQHSNAGSLGRDMITRYNASHCIAHLEEERICQFIQERGGIPRRFGSTSQTTPNWPLSRYQSQLPPYPGPRFRADMHIQIT